MPSGGSNRLLSGREAATFLNVSKTWLYANRDRLGIPVYRVGSLLRFRVRDLENWLEANRERRSAGGAA